MAVNIRALFIGFLLAAFVQPLAGLRYLTLPPWMSLISAKNAVAILQGNGTRPVDCIILALEKNLRPSFFFFEPAKSWCALYATMQGYNMYGYAGRGYFVLGDDFYNGPGDVCPPISTLLYGMMNLAYATPNCLQNPSTFTLTSDGRCTLQGNKRPAVGAYYAAMTGDLSVSPTVKFYSLTKNQVRASLNIKCGSPVASVLYPGNAEPFCYAYFAYPKGTDPQAACERKFPGSVVQWNNPSRPASAQYGLWGNFGYFAYLPDPGSATADYVFYEGTGPETDIIDYPFVGCAKYNVAQSTPLALLTHRLPVVFLLKARDKGVNVGLSHSQSKLYPEL